MNRRASSRHMSPVLALILDRLPRGISFSTIYIMVFHRRIYAMQFRRFDNPPAKTIFRGSNTTFLDRSKNGLGRWVIELYLKCLAGEVVHVPEEDGLTIGIPEIEEIASDRVYAQASTRGHNFGKILFAIDEDVRSLLETTYVVATRRAAPQGPAAPSPSLPPSMTLRRRRPCSAPPIPSSRCSQELP